MTSRRWMITIYSDWTPKLIEGLSYLVCQRETCPTTGKLHYQVYAISKKSTRVSGIKKLFGMDTIHVEAARLDNTTCINYCTKDKTRESGPWTFGSAPVGQGKRSDLDEFAKDIKNLDKPLCETAMNTPGMVIKYARGMTKLRELTMQYKTNTFRTLDVQVIWGAPGIGKTYYVYQQHSPRDIYKLVCSSDTVWWDGYDGQKILLIDEFKGWIPFTFLLQVLDKYPLMLPVKGGFVYANWNTVYIVSNFAIEDWYDFRSGKYAKSALERRLSHVTKWEGNTIPPTLIEDNLNIINNFSCPIENSIDYEDDVMEKDDHAKSLPNDTSTNSCTNYQKQNTMIKQLLQESEARILSRLEELSTSFQQFRKELVILSETETNSSSED